jgi:hypothetical protein
MTSISLSPIPVLFILNLALVSKTQNVVLKIKIVGFFGQLCDVASQSGDHHPKEDFAKLGYKLNMKLCKKIKIELSFYVFALLTSTMFRNMTNFFKFSSNYGY